MYLADLLNSHGLFQRCATWMQDQDYANDISLMLNRGTAAVVAILRMEELQRLCVQEFGLFDDQIENTEDRIVFNSRSMVALQNEISPLLYSLRIMQDLVNVLVRKRAKKSIPRSISETIKKLDKYGLPNDLKDRYVKYWTSGGSRIRDYRDLDTHYTSIVEHVFLQLAPSKKVLLLFPDNPQVKSKAKLTYDKEICGISTLRIGFDDLHEFVESVAEFFAYGPTELPATVGMSQLGDLRPFRRRTIAFHYESPITAKADGGLEMNISGIRVGQLDDGRAEFQKLYLSKEKLEGLKG